MKKTVLFSTIVTLAFAAALAVPAWAYTFGDNWQYNWCTKCGKYFKHVGKDLSAKAGQTVTFTETMYFVTKGYDSTWKEWLVARDAKNTYTYVVWHISGIPSFKSGDNLKGKVIGKVANLGSNSHVHVGYRNAPYNSFLSMKGALPNCTHNSYKYSVNGGKLPIYAEKFDVPYIKVSIK
jgi:hypothetical protein